MVLATEDVICPWCGEMYIAVSGTRVGGRGRRTFRCGPCGVVTVWDA